MSLPTKLAPNAFLPKSLKSELDLPGPVREDGPKKQAKLIQERLYLAGFKLAIDGAFGPATTEQLKAFQKKSGLAQSGIYGAKEHDVLTEPFVQAVNPTAGKKGLGEWITAVAEQHIGQKPIEVGGDNRGPWVRMYMDGGEGSPFKWCAGFCFFIIEQACQLSSNPSPMAKSFSVNTIVERAKTANQFLSEQQAQSSAGKKKIAPGSLFVHRGGPGFWTHVGIVTKADPSVFHTCEGNTNDDGSSNGFEAIERVRGYKRMDFIVW